MDIKRKDCIVEFIAAWKQWDDGREYDASKINWPSRLQEAGYYRVEAGKHAIQHDWKNIHKWCEEEFGKDHYIWTGSTWWFETERDAMWFALRWG